MIPDNIKNYLQFQKNVSEHNKDFGTMIWLFLGILPSVLLWLMLYLSSYFVPLLIRAGTFKRTKNEKKENFSSMQKVMI